MKTQKRIALLLILCSSIYFAIFCLPNHAASENLQTVKQALLNFASYDYYFYGYPYFAYSALIVLPIKLLNRLDDIPLVMVTLRQMVSVLPMLAAVLVLVYLQTKFKSYKAFVLFAFLLSIPALVQNNLWWHPDSLAILFAMLTIYFLNRDGLRFGHNFYFAAAMCGFSAGTKGIGFYFVLTIFVHLLIGWLAKKKPLSRWFCPGWVICWRWGLFIWCRILCLSTRESGRNALKC
jgi:hypothetical protein